MESTGNKTSKQVIVRTATCGAEVFSPIIVLFFQKRDQNLLLRNSTKTPQNLLVFINLFSLQKLWLRI